MVFIGIDPGLTGGIAVLDSESRPLYVGAFTPDLGEFNPYRFADTLTNIRLASPVSILPSTCMVVGLEKVHAMPGQGVSSMFTFGTVYGKIQGVLAAKHIPYQLVTPQAWTKVMLAGEDKAEKKNRAKLVVKKLWPDLPLHATARSRTMHSGMADAILIAEFMRRRHVGQRFQEIGSG